ncbi:Gfo/Idh/MocA family oxidoreductase [uncultured Thioclava sp.]|uniref:Gfo/Idh/MocA family protein n=1 Tax=uncultured Thioclava sp. TaxID=473858 RepID=UPI0025E57427|nr:Gfo/Idh/MocA family oxidoreductase [uncultured Thioclava sp.]
MNWALLGASTIASQYMIAAIRAAQQGTVGWVVSGNADRAQEFSKTHEISQWTTSIADALADETVQAVYISSTNEKHFAQVMAAISAGKHVLCEKPLAMTAAQAAEMIAAAKVAGVTLSVNHHLRCAGSHRKIRELIASGAVGRVLSLRLFHAVHLPEHLRGWRLNAPRAGGGAIADLTVHNADTARFLLQEDPCTVVAEMSQSGMGNGVEDSAMSVWTMPSGVMVFSHESFTQPFTESGIEVHGTDGSIVAVGVFAQDPLGEITLVNRTGRIEVPFDKTEIYEAVIREFTAATRGRGAPAATGADGAKSLLIATAVREAALTGVCQTISYGVVE